MPLIPNTFNTQSGPIPLSELDNDILVSVISCPSISALRLNTQSISSVFVQGYRTFADGGQGIFFVNTNDTTSADNGGTIIVDAGGNRWYRGTSNGSGVNVQWFGAYGDNTHDDTAAINSAIALGSNLYFPNTGNPYLITVASGLNPIGGVSIIFQPGAIVNHSGFGATFVYAPGGSNIATRIDNIGIESTTAAYGVLFQGGTGLTYVDNPRIYPFTGGTHLKFSQTFQYIIINPYLRNCASGQYLIDIDNSTSGMNNAVNEVKIIGGNLINDLGTNPSALVNLRIGNNWRFHDTYFGSHGSGCVAVDIGNDNLQSSGPEFFTMENCHFEGTFTNVARTGGPNAVYQNGQPRDIRLSWSNVNGSIVNVYNLNQTNGFVIEGNVWPNLSGFNYTISSSCSNGLVVDTQFNSVFASIQGAAQTSVNIITSSTAWFAGPVQAQYLWTGGSGEESTTVAKISSGPGSPNGSLSGQSGDMFQRKDGTIGTHLYICNGTTTWTAVSGV